MNKRTDQQPDLRVETPEEAGKRLGLDRCVLHLRRTILAMARRGELRTRRVSKYTMIVSRSVDDLLAGRK